MDSVGCGPSFRFMWAVVPFDVGRHHGDVGRCFGEAGQPGLPRRFRHQGFAGFPFCHCCSIRAIFDRSGSQ